MVFDQFRHGIVKVPKSSGSRFKRLHDINHGTSAYIFCPRLSKKGKDSFKHPVLPRQVLCASPEDRITCMHMDIYKPRQDGFAGSINLPVGPVLFSYLAAFAYCLNLIIPDSDRTMVDDTGPRSFHCHHISAVNQIVQCHMYLTFRCFT